MCSFIVRKLVRVPYLPVLRPRFAQVRGKNNYDLFLKLEIINIGPGVATDITVKYSVKTNNTSQTDKIELLEAKALSPYLNLDQIPPITDRG